jgi:hypothetical protein
LGTGEFAQAPLQHVARGVYRATLATGADLEYYVEVKPQQGESLRWPPTAPKLNQTVVVVAGQ